MTHARPTPPGCYDLLDPLLQALRWPGTTRQRVEALPPHAVRTQTLSSRLLGDVMAELGYTVTRQARRLTQDDAHLLPLLLTPRRGAPKLVTHPDALARCRGRQRFLTFALTEHDGAIDTDKAGIAPILHRFRGVFGRVMVVSFLIGLLALAPTFFNMALYDHIIASGAPRSLPPLLAGVGLALGLELAARGWRNRQLGYFAARLDHVVNCAVFRRLLLLPASLTDKASVAAQLARLRDFEAVREFLTSPLAGLLFEMPLVLMYLGVMALLAGPVAWAPAGLIAAYVVLMLASHGRLKTRARLAAQTASRRQEFALEMLTKLPAIRLDGLADVWQERYARLSHAATLAGSRATLQAQWLEIASYVLMTAGVLATLCLGVHHVIAGDLSVGALIAAMMLIWRIMSPLQIVCAAMTRLQQLSASTQQVRRLLDVKAEQTPDTRTAPVLLKGHVAFSRVTLRYTQEAEPALLGVSFEVQPGQIVAIRGANGSGKSSILKLILGLYQPQGGAVRLDGIDLRQFDARALRQAIAYVPQTLDFLPGTIRDNLRFTAPDATDGECWQALEQACARDDVLALPDGIDTIVAGDDAHALPFLLQQRLNLARAYVRRAAILLCDEASQSLGQDNDAAFQAMIAALRGRATVFLVTHSEAHLRLADQIFLIDRGELVAARPAPQSTPLSLPLSSSMERSA